MNIKYLVSTGTLILIASSIGGYSAKATLKSKISGALSIILNKSNLTNKLTVPSRLKSQVDSLISKGEVVGSTADKFNHSKLSLTSSHYYHQNINEKGEEITLISKTLPKVKSIEESVVKVSYTDINGEKNKFETKGIPRWITGQEIIEQYKKILEETDSASSESSKLLSTTTSSKVHLKDKESKVKLDSLLSKAKKSMFSLEEWKVTDSLRISPDMKNDIRELMEKNKISGNDIPEFDYSGFKELYFNNFYHQYKDSDGYINTLISQSAPKVTKVDGENVTVEYKDINGKKVTSVTKGIPIWIIGIDIKSKIKDDLKTRKKEMREQKKSDDLSHLGASAPTLDYDSNLDFEELEGLISGESNKQRQNDYNAAVGLGLTNYGFKDTEDSNSITSIKD